MELCSLSCRAMSARSRTQNHQQLPKIGTVSVQSTAGEGNWDVSECVWIHFEKERRKWQEREKKENDVEF